MNNYWKALISVLTGIGLLSVIPQGLNPSAWFYSPDHRADSRADPGRCRGMIGVTAATVSPLVAPGCS